MSEPTPEQIELILHLMGSMGRNGYPAEEAALRALLREREELREAARKMLVSAQADCEAQYQLGRAEAQRGLEAKLAAETEARKRAEAQISEMDTRYEGHKADVRREVLRLNSENEAAEAQLKRLRAGIAEAVTAGTLLISQDAPPCESEVIRTYGSVDRMLRALLAESDKGGSDGR